MQNGTASWEDSLGVSCKTQQTITIQFNNNWAPWYPAKGIENLCSHENLYKDVCCCFSTTIKSGEKPTCPAGGEWSHKLWLIQTKVYCAVLKQNELSSCKDMIDSQV
jgi:hypothetical protein